VQLCGTLWALESMSESENNESILRRIAPILTVLGVGLYAYLTYVYQRLYTSMDIVPSDVGFTYATTLGPSTGLIVAGLITFMGLVGLRVFLGALLTTVFFNDFIALVPTIVLLVVLWIALPFVLYPVTEPAREADIAARQVKVGLPVAPVHLFGVTVMDFRADAADVEVNGKPGASPSADALATRTDLLYLGRTEGIVVLFDPASDQPIQVPANAIIVRLERPVARTGRSPVCVLDPTLREWWQKPLVGPLRRWRPRC
jgi:hypothetical protein